MNPYESSSTEVEEVESKHSLGMTPTVWWIAIVIGVWVFWILWGIGLFSAGTR